MDLDYTMVAEARGQRVLWFRRFGSYQGEWLLMSCTDDQYFLFSGYYGSCSGCDAIESEFSYDPEELAADDPKVQKFIADYHPFLEMSREAALGIAIRDGNLLTVLPRNRREYYDPEYDQEAAGRQLALIVKAEEGTISATEILQLDNQEIRRETLERFGAERFMKELSPPPVCLDIEGDDRLYLLPPIEHSNGEDFVFLYLKDASTPRRYILRVDPRMRTVRDARAASFGIAPEDFVLAHET